MDKRGYKKNAYIEGSTVRQLYAVPEEEEYGRLDPLPERRKKPDRQKRVQKSRKRNQRRQSLDLKSTLFLAGAVCVTIGACSSYLKVQSGINQYDRQIAALESEIMSLEDENTAARDRINGSVDLSHVYDVATRELGMVHPGKDQIVTYESTKSDFVRQYGEIPEGKR